MAAQDIARSLLIELAARIADGFDTLADSPEAADEWQVPSAPDDRVLAQAEPELPNDNEEQPNGSGVYAWYYLGDFERDYLRANARDLRTIAGRFPALDALIDEGRQIDVYDDGWPLLCDPDDDGEMQYVTTLRRFVGPGGSVPASRDAQKEDAATYLFTKAVEAYMGRHWDLAADRARRALSRTAAEIAAS